MTLWSKDDLERARAKWGGPSADRLAERSAGSRPRAAGKKWHGRRLIDDEESEQRRLFDLLALPMVRAECPDLEFFHHVPNGAARPKKTAGTLKVTGVTPGVLDCRWDARRPYPDVACLVVEPAPLAIVALAAPSPPVHVGPFPSRTNARIARPEAAGLVIELKAGANGASVAQARWLCWLASQGFACFLAWSGVDAFNLTMAYAGLPFWADENAHVHRSRV